MQTIEIRQAWKRLKASYLSERHSEQLLFALLEEGLLKARGIPESWDGGTTSDAIIEDISQDFWILIDADWDSPSMGISTGRFSSSGQYEGLDSDDDDNCINRSRLSDSTIDNERHDPRHYRNVQVSWTEIQAALEKFRISKDDLQLPPLEDQGMQSGRRPIGRKMSEQWPVWIGVACKLAYEHIIHRTSTANSIVDNVFKHAPPELHIAKATVWTAAMAIAEAIGSSSLKHRFGELDTKPEPVGSKTPTS